MVIFIKMSLEDRKQLICQKTPPRKNTQTRTQVIVWHFDKLIHLAKIIFSANSASLGIAILSVQRLQPPRNPSLTSLDFEVHVHCRYFHPLSKQPLLQKRWQIQNHVDVWPRWLYLLWLPEIQYICINLFSFQIYHMQCIIIL